MTHPIVEAAHKAFWRVVKDEKPRPEHFNTVVRAALLKMRKPGTIGRLTPWTAAPNAECSAALILIQGYIDAVLREIEG